MSRGEGGKLRALSCPRRGAIVSLLAATLLPACGLGLFNRPALERGGKLYAVTAESTAFYRYGPQQGSGPDMSLPRDTLVNLIRPSLGYSKVKLLADGQEGFVASEDIQAAPPHLAATMNAPAPAPAAFSPAPAAEQFNLNSDDSRVIAPPEALPNPDVARESAAPTPW